MSVKTGKQRERGKLRGRIAELEEALRPFADHARGTWHEEYPDDEGLQITVDRFEATGSPSITVGDLRRAATVLNKQEEPARGKRREGAIE
jgi:hypothetical protein